MAGTQKIECSKCGESKYPEDFDERYINLMFVFKRIEVMDMVRAWAKNAGDDKTAYEVKPSCKDCFDESDEAFLKKNEYFCNPAVIGFVQCSLCKNWIKELGKDDLSFPEIGLVLCDDCYYDNNFGDNNDDAKEEMNRLGYKACLQCNKWFHPYDSERSESDLCDHCFKKQNKP